MVLTAFANSPVGRQGCRHIPFCSLHPDQTSQATRSMASQSRLNAQRAPLIGEYRQLVILASFSDKTFKDEDPLEVWDKIFNQEDFREQPFYGSVHDYFFDQSYGKFSLHFDLYHVKLDKNSSIYRSSDFKYEKDDQWYADDTGCGLLLTHLLDAMKDQVEDWSVYDWNSDGFVDQVFILFAGKGQNDGGGSNSIWPNQWNLTEMGEEPYFKEWGHPYDLSDTGWNLQVDNYGCFGELTAKGNYAFGTLCHEYGHCLGLPDFYYGSSSQVVGTWDVMDYGNNNLGGYCPPGYSAHERMVLGWLDVQELTEPTSLSDIKPLGEGGEAYLIRNDGYENEYYIVENRQQTGWDQSLPGSGVVVFHIDYDEEVWENGVPNSSTLKRYSIIPANNRSSVYSSSTWPYPFQLNDALTNTSAPKASLIHPNINGEKLMSKPITAMSITDGLASFDFMGGSTAVSPITIIGDDASYVVYTLQGRMVGTTLNALSPGIYIIRNARGETRKVRILN